MDNIPYEDALATWLQDPEFKREYDALEPAYLAACLRIEEEMMSEPPILDTARRPC